MKRLWGCRVVRGLCYGFVAYWGTVLLAFYGSCLIGGGHGTAFFLALVIYPDVAGYALWPTAAGLLPWRHLAWIRLVVACLLLLNYASVAWYVNTEELYGVIRTFRAVPLLCLLVGGLYLAAQVVFWTALLRRKQETGYPVPATAVRK